MHLGNGGRSQRRLIEGGEQLAGWGTQRAGDLGDGDMARKGCNVILQALQGRDVLIRQQVPAQAYALAELDKGRAQAFEHPAQAPRGVFGGAQQMQSYQQPPGCKRPQRNADLEESENHHIFILTYSFRA